MFQILDISESGYHLSLRRNHLVAGIDGKEAAAFCLSDLHSIVVHAPQTTYSHALLQECSEKDIHFIVCDKHHLPSFILYPFGRRYEEGGRIAVQAEASVPAKKRLWQQVVRLKLFRQHDVLNHFQCGKSEVLKSLARSVKSGDKDNREAVGAGVYWKQLFGAAFRRDRFSGGINAALNYGYTLMRSATARAVSGAGLCPALGIHHSNKNNSFCLVDDLMEPFRPLVDYYVKKKEEEFMSADELTKEHRAYLCSMAEHSLDFGDERYSLMYGLSKYVFSFIQALQDGRRQLAAPVRLP